MKHRFGDRILGRLYRYQASVLFVVLGATACFWAFVITPRHDRERAEALTWVAERVLARANRPEELAEEVASVRKRVPLTLTVYREDANVLATNEERPPVLDAATIAQLATARWVALDEGRLAIASRPEGAPTCYAIVGANIPWKNGHTFVIVALTLGAIALASIPAAKAIARPLEELARKTSAFGLGDLRVRAEPHAIVELDEVAKSFNQMADRIESLRRTEKELLANVSHELRTPLARIRVVVELASEEDPETAKRYLADIAEDLSEVEHILEDIITTSRLDLADRANDPFTELRRSDVALEGLFDALAKRFGAQHPARILAVDVDEPFVVEGDRVLLKHALANLLDNAEKYSSTDAPVTLSAARCREGKTVRITVTDRGRGIAAQDLASVFQPFFRADRSRTRQTGGVGLGLTLAKRIVEAHGGAIAIQSHLDAGTVVTVSLPIEQGGPA